MRIIIFWHHEMNGRIDWMAFLDIFDLIAVFPAPCAPGGAYSPDGTMGYMMDGQQMVHRPPGEAAFHNEAYHYPPQYYGHHL